MNVEHYQLFDPHEYPFWKDLKNPPKQAKTMIPCSTLASCLEIIISLNHPNIVQIEKVSRCTHKGSLTLPSGSYYALYYEKVPYSLKKVTRTLNKIASLPPLPTREELC